VTPSVTAQPGSSFRAAVHSAGLATARPCRTAPVGAAAHEPLVRDRVIFNFISVVQKGFSAIKDGAIEGETIMAIQQLYVAPQAHQPALRRIRQFSLPFEFLFAGLTILNALLFVLGALVLLFGGDALGIHFLVSPESGELVLGEITAYPPGSIDVTTLSLGSRLGGLLVLAGVVGTSTAAFYSLHRLFGAYRRGIVFAEPSIRKMRWAGFFLLAAGLAPLAFQPLVQALGLLDERLFPRQSLAFLIVGASLFVLAYVIALGREIEQDAEGYV
jgi:hypothetical protein